MEDLKNLDIELLLEMLAIYTAEYTNMLSQNIKGAAFDDCEFNLSRLQAAINARLTTTDGAENTQNDNNFEHVPHK